MGAQIRNLRRIMRSTTTPATPIYVTELGWGSDSGPTRWERGLQGQANQLSQAFAMLSSHRLSWRIGGAWWFTWSDEGGSCQFCRSAGLLTVGREAKPAWYRFNAWTGGNPGTVPRALFGEDVEPVDEALPEPEAALTAPELRRARLRLNFRTRFRGDTRWLSRFLTCPTPTTRSSRTSTRRRCGSTTTSTTRPTSTKRTPRSRAPSGPTRDVEDVLQNLVQPARRQAGPGPQQRRRPLQPLALLADDEPGRRRRARAATSATRSTETFGSFDAFKDEFKERRHHPVRLRLGLAGARRLRARGGQNRRTRTRRSPTARRRCSASTSGSTPTTSSTRTSAPTTSTPSGTSSTGTTSPSASPTPPKGR